MQLSTVTIATLFAAALLGPLQAQAGLNLFATKRKDKTHSSQAVLTFKTGANPGDIDSKQIAAVEEAMKSSCNKAYPKEEIFMIDAQVQTASRSHEVKAQEFLRGDSAGKDDDFVFVDWRYVYGLIFDFECNLCPPDTDDDALMMDAVTKKGKKKGHLKQWEKAVCEDLESFDLGFPVYDCAIEVPFEEDQFELVDIIQSEDPVDLLADMALSAATAKKKDKTHSSQAVLTFKTGANPDDIDSKQIAAVEDAMKSSCNKAHPKEEIFMIDAQVQTASRSHESKAQQFLRGDSAGKDDDFVFVDWRYVYGLIFDFECNLCPPDTDDDALMMDAVTKKGKKKGHLKQWEKAVCEDLESFDIGFPVYDCAIEVPFEDENGFLEDIGSANAESM